MSESIIRVLIVDDDPLVRAGLRLLLGGSADIEIVGECSDGDEVLAAVRGLDPHVVLMDVRMLRLDGISALRELRRELPEHPVAVVMLTTFRSDASVLDALRAGAAGFVLKHTPPGEIVEAVRTAASGSPTVSPDVLRQLIEHVAASAEADTEPTSADSDGLLDPLSEREREVAFAVADGLGNAEIAARLFLSVGSVKAHISSALAKLGLDNRIQLAILAHDARGTSVPPT